MRSSLWGRQESSEMIPTQQSVSALESSGNDQVTHEVLRSFVLEDLVLSKVKSEVGTFVANFLLSRSEGGQSGKNQIPESPPTYLSLKVDNKELALLSGLLNREIYIRETRRTALRVQELERELRALHEEKDLLEEENTTLKQFLMESQRPRKIS